MFSITPALAEIVASSCCPLGIECLAHDSGFCWFSLHERPPSEVPREEPAVPKKRTAPAPTSASNTGTKKAKAHALPPPPPPPPATSVPIRRAQLLAAATLPPAPRPAPAAPPGLSNTRRPVIAASLTTRVERSKRQKVLDHFFGEFQRIYAPLEKQDATLPHKHAFDQEDALQRKCTNSTAYMTLAQPILNRLKKRPVATSMTDTGIDGIWFPPTTSPHGPLFTGTLPSLDHFTPLLLTPESLHANAYPTLQSLFETMTQPPLTKSALQKVACDRCKADFTPHHTDDMVPHDWEACTYHRSRSSLQVLNGTAPTSKTRIYACCQLDQTSRGCSTGPHVFKDRDFSQLNARIPFTSLPENPDPILKVAGIDCEMSYTTGGMELTRCTVVDAGSGEVVLDELVKTKYPVLDLNSDYSGITDLSKATHTLSTLHQLLSLHISPSTLLIGHGLENDLTALRLIHPHCIDTAVLFPRVNQPVHNPTGMVYKHSLKVLCEKVLGKRIQVVNDQTVGHDSAEDARAAVELVLFWVRQKERGVAVTY
ncbi:RNA exonuclease 3 [Podochytrium sp. JEL0797]|nr:RNA exonuclease 3 [Podochytrium sp. JEL0797]